MKKKKKDMQTQKKKKKQLNGAIWWLYREWRGEVVRAHGWCQEDYWFDPIAIGDTAFAR